MSLKVFEWIIMTEWMYSPEVLSRKLYWMLLQAKGA